MSDLAGSAADGTMASKAVEAGQRDCGCIRASWERSWTAINSVVWMAWRRGKSLTGEGVRNVRRESIKAAEVLMESDLHSRKVRGWQHSKGKTSWELLWKRAEGKKRRKLKGKCETKIVSTSLVLQNSGTLIWWIHIQRVLEKSPLLPLVLSTFIYH